MSRMNRLANAANPYQGGYKRVLCVCSAGLLRSPTAAVVLSGDPYRYNTRAVGASEEFALVPLDEVLLTWADEVVFMQHVHFRKTAMRFPHVTFEYKILGIEDNYRYRDEDLVRLIQEKYDSMALQFHENEDKDNG